MTPGGSSHSERLTALKRQKAATAAVLAGIVFGMIGLSFAAVPLYRIFCSVTGYAGTTQRAAASPKGDVAAAVVTVRFDATTSPDLDWDFQPEQTAVEVHPGETKVATYRAVNHSSLPLTGTATYNVTPYKAGVYFNKVQCFCFTKQHLKPGESADLSVAFFVDPDILSDPATSDVKTITLSYSMFRAKDDETQGAAAKPLVQRRDDATTQPSSVN
jgi:cytochrome c oxidase assembly protein subunit 11